MAERPVPTTERARERRDQWSTWMMIAGIVFVATFVAGILLAADTPDYDAADQEWTDWFDDGGNRAMQIVALFLLVISALAFVVFITGLVRRVRTAVSGRDGIAQVALIAGSTFAALTAVAAVALTHVSLGIEFADIPIPSADVLRAADLLAFGTLLVAGALFAALSIVSVTLAARGTWLFPRWLSIASIVAAVVVLFSVVFIPMAVLPLWVLAVAVTVGRRSAPPVPGTPGEVSAAGDVVASTGSVVSSGSHIPADREAPSRGVTPQA